MGSSTVKFIPRQIATTILCAHCHYFLTQYIHSNQFSSVQSLSCVRLFVTPWIAACQASLVHHHLPEFTQTHVHRVGDTIQPSHPLLSLFPLAAQGTLKSLLQPHSSKSSILWCSAFFIVQLSHPYMTTGKTIALTRWTFVGKIMSLLLNNAV